VTVRVEVPVAFGVAVWGTLVAVVVTVGVLVKVGGTPVAVAVGVAVMEGVAEGVTRLEGRSMRGATQTALSFAGEPFVSTVRMNFT